MAWLEILTLMHEETNLEILTMGEQAIHWLKAGVHSSIFSKSAIKPRIECGIFPRHDVSLPLANPLKTKTSLFLAHYKWIRKRWEAHSTYFFECCNNETNNSTPIEAAILETPGRVTVHCWSKVRSVWDCIKQTNITEWII